MKLHYLPDGDPRETERWLAGIPASDFETDDQRVIEACLSSGLYAEADEPEATPARAKPVAPPTASPPAPDAPEAPVQEAG